MIKFITLAHGFQQIRQADLRTRSVPPSSAYQRRLSLLTIARRRPIVPRSHDVVERELSASTTGSAKKPSMRLARAINFERPALKGQDDFGPQRRR